MFLTFHIALHVVSAHCVDLALKVAVASMDEHPRVALTTVQKKVCPWLPQSARSRSCRPLRFRCRWRWLPVSGNVSMCSTVRA